MKILIIVSSKHNDNTLKIAEAMSEVAPVTLCNIDDVDCFSLNQYDIVGLGSGIYFGKHDKKLFELVKNKCKDIKSAFVFSTSGNGKQKNNTPLIKLLKEKNINVCGNFTCKGKTNFFPLSLFGGINKTHPDIQDFDNAQTFIQSLI
jgi:flavodoxin